jgi:uncharacterized membrane protein
LKEVLTDGTNCGSIARSAALIKAGSTVTAMFVPGIICLTVIASLFFGIVAAYGLTTGILQMINFLSRPSQPTKMRIPLVPAQSQASGD